MSGIEAAVAALKESPRGYTAVTVSERTESGRTRVYNVPSELCAVAELRVGETVSEETAELLASGDECISAYRRAVRMLSFSDRSAVELRTRLRAAYGFSAKAADFAVSRLLSEGLLDEERQIKGAVRHCANEKLWGRDRIIPALVSRGYRRALVASAIREAEESGDIDFSANFDRLLRRTHPETGEERRRLRFKYGYAPSDENI